MRQNLDSDIALSGGWSCLVSSLSLKRSERCDCAETEKKRWFDELLQNATRSEENVYSGECGLINEQNTTFNETNAKPVVQHHGQHRSAPNPTAHLQKLIFLFSVNKVKMLSSTSSQSCACCDFLFI